MREKILWVVAAAVLGVGCGGSDPGTGSGTLFVTADFSSDGTPDGTVALIVVRDGAPDGAFVEDATVLVTPEGGNEISIPFVDLFLVSGYYKTNFAPWSRSFRVKVTRATGTDRVEALVEAPGLTEITAPADGSTFDRAAGAPLAVTWTDSFGRRAQGRVRVESRFAEVSQNSNFITLQDDPLRFEIPFSAWEDPVNNERIRVTRTNSVVLAGGIPGSVGTASTTDRTLDFTVQ